ncbi:MAG: M23 family peptidase [Methylobacterium sp.]|nr:M23 family peptidase [Methylobacterium sp.]
MGISSIPLFGIVTAFGIAPQTITRDIEVSTVVEQVSLPEPANIDAIQAAEVEPFWQVDQIRKDDTLSALLNRLNIRNEAAIRFLRTAPEASGLASQLRPGRTILAKTTADGELIELQYQISLDQALVIRRAGGDYLAESPKLALQQEIRMNSAVIESSLFAASDAANIPDNIALQLADIFSSDIDFHLDLRKGDRFSVVYEAGYNNGEIIKSGQILAAEFVNDGKTYRAVLFRGADGQAQYYTPEGKNLHKSFLRSPLEFSRVSSGFSLARFHPVLQEWRAHKGVDYAAPIGTRIKATAEGVVSFIGTQGGYGNVVMLQHANGISTVYGHLSRFAGGLRNGSRIAQGQIIGQVGMTGTATGPHLHYEFRVHGVHRDPLKVALPVAVPLAQDKLAAFGEQSGPLLARLSVLRGTNTAAVD